MKQKEFFLIALTVFLTVVAWIVADIHHIMTTSQIIDKAKLDMASITVDIDESVLKKLEEKK